MQVKPPYLVSFCSFWLLFFSLCLTMQNFFLSRSDYAQSFNYDHNIDGFTRKHRWQYIFPNIPQYRIHYFSQQLGIYLLLGLGSNFLFTFTLYLCILKYNCIPLSPIFQKTFGDLLELLMIPFCFVLICYPKYLASSEIFTTSLFIFYSGSNVYKLIKTLDSVKVVQFIFSC